MSATHETTITCPMCRCYSCVCVVNDMNEILRADCRLCGYEWEVEVKA